MIMRKNSALSAGIAAFALMAAPAVLAQGNGNGGGKGKNKGSAQSAQPKGNGNQNAVGGSKRGGNEKRTAGQTRPNQSSANGNSSSGRSDNQSANNAKSQKADTNRAQNSRANGGANGNRAAIDQRGNAANHKNDKRAQSADFRSSDNPGNGDRLVQVRSRDGSVLNTLFALPQLRQTMYRDTRLIDGCPPGLAKKRNGCLPPGQAKDSYRTYDPGFFGLSGVGGGRYLYDDGYLLSYRGDSLAGYLPLLGGALGIGNIWPSYYQPAPLPSYYDSYYGLGEPRGYRFAEDVIYRVDPETAAITSVAALLTGDDITVGQPMPRGYDVYNVPYQYRNQYADGPSARYRYADGYMYEVNPETALVVAAIDLVT